MGRSDPFSYTRKSSALRSRTGRPLASVTATSTWIRSTVTFTTCSGRGSGAADCRPPAVPRPALTERTHTIAHVQRLQRIVHLPNPRCRPAADIPYADLEEGAGSMVQTAWHRPDTTRHD